MGRNAKQANAGGIDLFQKKMPIFDVASSFTKSQSLFQVQCALNSGAINEGRAALVVAAWARRHLGCEVTL